METYLSKQQRSAEKGKDTTPVLAALAVVIIVMASCGLHGCASFPTAIQVSENKCASQNGSWEYTDADGFRKFRCDLPVATSTAADRKLVGSIR